MNLTAFICSTLLSIHRVHAVFVPKKITICLLRMNIVRALASLLVWTLL